MGNFWELEIQQTDDHRCGIDNIAYHDRILGKDFSPIIEAYNYAVSQGLYRQVPRNTGDRLWDAYALKNHSEYFAELTEAYFGENDFYPFTKQELEQYDPLGYQAIEQAWGITRL